MAFVGRAAITLLDRSLRANVYNNIIYWKVKEHGLSRHSGVHDLQECYSGKIRQLNQGYLAEIHDGLVKPTTFHFVELVANPFFGTDASFWTRCNIRRRYCHRSCRFL